MSVIDRVLPHYEDAELSALGAMMLDMHAAEALSHMLQPDDFYAPRHRVLFNAIQELTRRSDAVDLVTVRAQLERQDSLEEAGGLAYLAHVADYTPSASNAEHYGRLVKEASILRRLYSASQEISKIVFQAELTAKEAVDQAEQLVFDVASEKDDQKLESVGALLTPAMDQIELIQKSGRGMMGLPTGFRDLDRMTAGLMNGDLIIIAARPSMGKTSLALSIAENIAHSGEVAVALFSLEMSKEQLVTRLICSEAKVNSQRIRLGAISDSDWAKLTKACNRLDRAPLYIDDTPAATMFDIRAKCRRLRDEKPLGLVVIDYLQLMSTANRSENRNQEIAEIARGLKAFARDFKTPVIALSQLSRAIEKRTSNEPLLSDLRESGAIEAEADVVMFIHRDLYYDKKEAQDEEPVEGHDRTETADIVIAKQRNGPTGKVRIGFQPDYTKFVTIERAAPPDDY